MLIITTVLFSMWSIGVLVIILSFSKVVLPTENNKQGFIYSGQIITENGMPLAGANAYLVIANDTIKAETVTGADGTFVIRLDTLEGIKATIHYEHPVYGSDTRFRPLIQSTPEQFQLKKRAIITFSTNSTVGEVNTAISRQTGITYTSQKATFLIQFIYDKTALDSSYSRYRYLGGKVTVFINGNGCCTLQHAVPATHAAGTTKDDLEIQLNASMQKIIKIEKDHLSKKIAQCIESLSH